MALILAPYSHLLDGRKTLVEVSIFDVGDVTAFSYVRDAAGRGVQVPVTWEQNTPFYESMTFTGERGYSSRFNVVSTEGVIYGILPSDLIRYLGAGVLEGRAGERGSHIDGQWRIVKRNKAYSLQLYRHDLMPELRAV